MTQGELVAEMRETVRLLRQLQGSTTQIAGVETIVNIIEVWANAVAAMVVQRPVLDQLTLDEWVLQKSTERQQRRYDMTQAEALMAPCEVCGTVAYRTNGRTRCLEHDAQG